MGNAIWDWSVTSNDNGAADSSINYQENQLPSTLNNSSRTVMARIKELMLDLSPTRTSGGTTTAYTVTSSAGHGTAPRAGQVVSFFAHATNGPNPTLNVDGTGAKAWRDRYATTGGIDAGRVILGIAYRATYNATLDAWITDFGGPAISLITSTVTKTVGGASPDFSTLAAAAEWFEGVVCGFNGYVVLEVRAGATAAMTSPVIFRSPYLDRLTIQGATMPATLSPNEFAITGVAVSGDITAALTLLRTKYATELVFSGANGWLGFVGAFPTLKRLLITSDRTPLTSAGGLVVINQGAIVESCSVHGSGGNGWSVRAGEANFKGTSACSATGCLGSGFAASGGGEILFTAGSSACANAVAGAAIVGASARATTGGMYYMGNPSGIRVTNGGSYEGTGGHTFSRCTNGIDADTGDVNLAGNGAFSNSVTAIYARASRVTANSMSFSTTGTGIVAQVGTIVSVPLASGTLTTSPAANTVGNQNSYIHV